MTPEELKYRLHEMDLLLNSHLVICNPKQYEQIKAALENQPFTVESDVAVEENKVIVVDRRKLDAWQKGVIDFD